jgi:hypothetical protein
LFGGDTDGNLRRKVQWGSIAVVVKNAMKQGLRDRAEPPEQDGKLVMVIYFRDIPYYIRNEYHGLI